VEQLKSDSQWGIHIQCDSFENVKNGLPKGQRSSCVLSSLSPPALHMACIGQHAAAARTLLQLGLRDSEDACGATAMQHARKPDVVRVFESGPPDLP